MRRTESYEAQGGEAQIALATSLDFWWPANAAKTAKTDGADAKSLVSFSHASQIAQLGQSDMSSAVLS